MKKTICAIMAHADDIEYGCAGGTLAKYIAEGHRALYGVMSRCNSGWTVTADKGGHFVPSSQIVPRRHAEAKAAAAVFGAEFYHGDLLESCHTRDDGTIVRPSFVGVGSASEDDIPEGTLFTSAASSAADCGDVQSGAVVNELVDLLVEWEPTLVLGQFIQNNNPDHFSALVILAHAWRIANEKVQIGPLWMSTGLEGNFVFPSFEPTHYVDVSGHVETALKAFSCHESQGCHLPQTQERVKKCWVETGKVAGFASAEQFVQLLPAMV